MATNLIHDRGRGPELVGTRITIYNLLPDFLDPTMTECAICRMYELTPEQVAAARSYILSNPDTVLAAHLKIEARMAAGNPPDLIEQARQTRATFQRFKEWLAEREAATAQGTGAESATGGERNGTPSFPTFREWLATQPSRAGEGP